MAILTMDGMVNGLGNAAQRKNAALVVKSGITGITGSNAFHTLNYAWTGNFGSMDDPAAFGSGGTLHDGRTQSGFPKILAASSGKQNYLARADLCGSAPCTLLVHDRLWSCSGFVNNNGVLYTIVGAPTLTRNASGEGNQVWAEIQSTATTGTATLFVRYTNQDGVTNKASQSVTIGAAGAGRAMPIYLAAGDTGVQKVESVTISGGGTNAAVITVSIVKPIVQLSVDSQSSTICTAEIYSWMETGFAKLDDGVALGAHICSNNGALPTLMLGYTVIEG